MKHYDDYSAEELKTMLQRYFLYADLDDAAVDEMEAILAALRKKAPFPHTHTTAEMWAEFQAEHAEELASLGIQEDEDTKEVVEKESEPGETTLPSSPVPIQKRRRLGRGILRVGLVAATVVVLMVAITVVASAIGFNLWGWVPQWSNEDLRFAHEDQGKPIVKNVPMVLDALGVEEPLYPTWLPEGFVLTETIIETDPFFLHDAYLRGDEFLSISITTSSSHTDTLTYQKDNSPYSEYISHGVCHFIFSDVNYSNATWNTQDYTVQIISSVPLEEMKKLIESVYEVQQ